mmetsp:Transcript_41980/g.100882  ORF Transcript_41980/g.100882 Transcript_41980/m.100882 type:complete len:1103 (+) Transcript_41980:157-3465(+)
MTMKEDQEEPALQTPPLPTTTATTGSADDIRETSGNSSNNSGKQQQQAKNDTSSSAPDVLLEGWMLKQNRNNHWQDRYFVFKSDQTISYRKKQDDDRPRLTLRVSTEAGCEVSELFVSQRSVGPGGSVSVAGAGGAGGSLVGTDVGTKETLYCVTLSWPDDTETVNTANLTQNASSQDEDDDMPGVPTLHLNGTTPSSPLSVTSEKKRGLLRKVKSRGTPQPITMDENGSTRSARSLGSRASQKLRKSILRRGKLKRGRSAPATDDNDYDDESIASLLDPPTVKLPPRDIPTPSRVDKLGMSMPNMKVDLKPRPNRIPTEVKMDMPPMMEGTRIDEEEGDSEHKRDDDDVEDDNAATLRRSLKDEYGVMTPTVVIDAKSSYEDQTLLEQEMLQVAFFRKQREHRSAMTKRAVGVTKVAVAASAAIGVGIITAGVGLAAGLVFLGGAAAIGGTAGVAEVGLRRTLKRKDHVTIATANYELAKLWKTMLDSCLEQESLKRSTWGQKFIADGRSTTTTLFAHDTGDIMQALSGDDADITHTISPKNQNDRSRGQSNLFLHDPKFSSQAKVRWRPLDGGWVYLLGPGAASIRLFKEERMRMIEKEAKDATPLAVRGPTTPFRTQVVLNAHPMEAFMCIMSYARMQSDELIPNSGQSTSFRLIEKIDEHTDVLHLVCRKLFLFPSWTEARDYVLLRYWRYEPDGSYIIFYESQEHPSCPPQPDYIRGELHQVYTIAPPKISDHRRLRGLGHAAEECMLSAVVQVDPKGWIPTRTLSFLSNQSYADAFAVSALHQTLDIRDAIENDRFLDTSPDLQPSTSLSKTGAQPNDMPDLSSDIRFVSRERCDSYASDKFPDIASTPKPLSNDGWAEPDSNSFFVRGPTYLSDRKKINAGASVGRLIAVDVVAVDEAQYGGMSMHPTERIQLALKREKRLKALGKKSDVPPFIFCVNIVLPGPPFFHGVFYFAVDDMSTIDGSDGTPSSKLCQKFLFGESDEFRDKTFKLIPRIVEGNFLVRKAVGSTPAIMGNKLKQYYVRNERFMEVILDCGSSPVATGVIRLSLGYAKTLVVDMCFLLEGGEDEHLPERVFGAVRIKYPTFDEKNRKVQSV